VPHGRRQIIARAAGAFASIGQCDGQIFFHAAAGLEQPVAREALRELRWVFDRCNVSVIADESCFNAADAARVIAAGAADVLALKFYKCAGLRRGREIATVAEIAIANVDHAKSANQ
jgi:L-alanine-DL-glutamate epimerase-like enolase superfamily enzyme